MRFGEEHSVISQTLQMVYKLHGFSIDALNQIMNINLVGHIVHCKVLRGQVRSTPKLLNVFMLNVMYMSYVCDTSIIHYI
jgi:hypothetical protein